MGSISPYETVRGRRYRVRYRKPDHTQTDKRGFKTKREAELFLASVEVAMSRGEFIDATSARSTISELGSIWLQSQTHLKPSTVRVVEMAYRVHVEPKWGRRAVGTIRHSEVQAWVASLPLGATSIRRAHGVLRSVLESAVRDRRISTNPARGVSLPRKNKKSRRYLTHAEVWALAEAAGEWGTVVLFLAYTGLRWGELAGLRVSSLDLARRRVSVTESAVSYGRELFVGTPKTHEARSVPFPRFLAGRLAELAESRSAGELLFGDGITHLRRPNTSANQTSWFIRALESAGLEPMTVHDLRHTAASLAISAGANVKAVQRMLGHASAAMTLDTYADLFEEDLDAVSDALDRAARSLAGY